MTTVNDLYSERTVPLRCSTSAIVRSGSSLSGYSTDAAMDDEYGVIVHIGAVSPFMSAKQAFDFGSALTAVARTIADGVAKAFPKATSPATEGSPS